METKIRAAVKWLGSKWTLGLTLAVFTAEAGWLAITSRFPMAYDEAWHFGLIRFFSHHLNPIITNQASNTYKLGNIVQDPSFLYHYLMSFPYRLIAFFTSSLELQVIGLRLINVALAVAGLIIMRKLLRLIGLSNALTNVVLLAFALTPLFTVLSAQISYDNLLIPAVSLCVYETVLFIKELDKEIFNTPRLLGLFSLCLLSSLVKYAFLPVLLAIAIVVIWKIAACWRRDSARLKTGFKKSFVAASQYSKFLLILASAVSGFLFARIYGVNLVAYHNPVPSCSQVLNVQNCMQYYAFDGSYVARLRHQAGLTPVTMNVLRYSEYWGSLSIVELLGTVMPLQGYYSASPIYFLIVVFVGIAAFCYGLRNFRKVLRENQYLSILLFAGAVYVFALWAKNYNGYLAAGKPLAVAGRYLVPVLIYFYALLAVGLQYALKSRRLPALVMKFGLAFVVIFSFVYFGGFNQYLSKIDPVYGRISPNNQYILGPK